MTDTISDKPKGATWLREFTRQQREEGTHPAIETLHKRPKARGQDNRKAVEYARIERGQEV